MQLYAAVCGCIWLYVCCLCACVYVCVFVCVRVCACERAAEERPLARVHGEVLAAARSAHGQLVLEEREREGESAAAGPEQPHGEAVGDDQHILHLSVIGMVWVC